MKKIYPLIAIALIAMLSACGGGQTATPLPPTPQVAPPTPTIKAQPVIPTASPLPPTASSPPTVTEVSMPPQLNYLPDNSPQIDATTAAQLQAPIELFAMSQSLFMSDLAFSPDGYNLAAVDELGSLQAWDLHNLDTIFTYLGEPAGFPRVAFSSSNVWLAATGSQVDADGAFVSVIDLWNSPDTAEPEVVVASRRMATSVTFSPDGVLMAAGTGEGMGGGGSLKIWETATGELVHTIDTSDWITDVEFSPDGRLVAGSSYGKVFVWDAQTGQEIRTLEVPQGPVQQIAFSPQGDTLAVMGNGLSVIDAVDGTVLFEIKPLNGLGMAFNQMGDLLITVGDQGLILWDALTGERLADYSADGSLIGLAVSPVGNALATISVKGMLQLWMVIP